MSALPDIAADVQVRFRYAVRFTRGLLRAENPLLRDAADGRLLAVIDGGLARARPRIKDELAAYCAAHGLELAAPPLVVPGGEAAKQDSHVVDAVRAAIDAHGIDRHSYVVVIGGGAVLAQDDSGVGVKNGVNAFGKKNFVGSFAPPHAVLCDLELLETLSDRDWLSGVSEAVKVALLRDAPFFAWLEAHAGALRARSLDAMATVVHRSAELHVQHIATGGDPFELGSSRPLDFGHWAAHKLEQLSGHGLRHGEAVAIGIALDCTYSRLTGRLPAADWERVVALFEALALPVWHPALASRELLDGLGEFREHLGGRLTVMLLDGIGAGSEVHALDTAVVREAAARLRRRTETEEARWEPIPALAR